MATTATQEGTWEETVATEPAPPATPSEASSEAVTENVAREEPLHSTEKPSEDSVDGDDEASPAVIHKEEKKEDGPLKDHLNIVFIGHVDAGKSTISGNLLVLTGMVDKRTIEKYEKEAIEKNRGTWFLAYIMDTNEDERIKGITVEVGRAFFETDHKRITILDAPGHKSYVPNMIGGAAQADVGVLVISARKGEFETGFEKGGQTREHALLAKTLGVNKLIVVINKMDEKTVQWSKERYDECVNKLTPYLKSVGYNLAKDVMFLPVSGFTGAGIRDPVPSDLCGWYTGPTLLQAFDSITLPDRKPNAAVRIPVIYKFKERGTVVAMGKVEAGTLAVGQRLVLMPPRTQVDVTAITSSDLHDLKRAPPGENVSVNLKGVEEEHIQTGFVLCGPELPIRAVSEFEAQLMILELLPHKALFTAGYGAVMHIHAAVEECTVAGIVEVIDPKTKKPMKRVPPFVKSSAVCKVRIELAQPVCMELFSDLPQLGRFTLRDEGKTIAIGKVTAILK